MITVELEWHKIAHVLKFHASLRKGTEGKYNTVVRKLLQTTQ